jgi:hypothetical protein
MTNAEDVQRYADAIMAMIEEDQDTGQVPAAFVPGTNSMKAWTLAIITGWPGCHRGAATRLTGGTLSTMRSAGALPEHKVACSEACMDKRREADRAGWRSVTSGRRVARSRAPVLVRRLRG